MPQPTYVLIPGRHHALTTFMADYFGGIARSKKAETIDGGDIEFKDVHLVWAVTSANHQNTRRNPVPGHRREAALEHFAQTLSVPSSVFLIDDVGTTDRFADHVLKDIEVQSRGRLQLRPDNTAVATSTPSVIAMFESLGYSILPIELLNRETGESAPRAWDVVVRLIEAGPKWRDDEFVTQNLHASSREILERYALDELMVEVYDDPLLGDEGDITDSRDYEEYRNAFERGAERKYAIVDRYVRPGRIVDIGCANGSIIALMSKDDRLRESDLYGIEVTRALYERCLQRKQNGDFGNENVFFYQRNIMSGKLFPDQSVQTTTAFSLTHEIESYLGRESLLKFLEQIYNHTAPGGVFINSDVVGPTNGDREVWLRLRRDDGVVEDAGVDMDTHATPEYLESLSTWSRFFRFAHDFRRAERQTIAFDLRQRDGETFVVTSLRNAAEFLSKMTYADSWYSEMHEAFCYWDFDQWTTAVQAAGFRVLPESEAYRNEWLVENRFRSTVELFTEDNGRLEPLDYPVTNMLIVAERVS